MMSVRPARVSNGRQDLLRFIEQRGQVSVADVCDYLTVSAATARRHLDALAERGDIARIHGGAIATRRTVPETPMLPRFQEQAVEKAAIGRAAAALINDGETIFLGSGTTVYEVALNLRDRRDLTVITNSILVLNALSPVEDITLVCLGGVVRRAELSMIGHLTELALAEVRAEKVVVGIRGLDLEQGLTHDYLPETMTDRAILKIAREVIVVADHSKLGRVSTAFVAPVSSMHQFVTDAGVPREYVAALAERGVRVIQAPL
jgi:DeoR family transcriptional regulator, aga operon transcriptional repressor